MHSICVHIVIGYWTLDATWKLEVATFTLSNAREKVIHPRTTAKSKNEKDKKKNKNNKAHLLDSRNMHGRDGYTARTENGIYRQEGREEKKRASSSPTT